MNRLLSSLLWFALPCAIVACKRPATPEVDEEESPSDPDDDDDDDDGEGASKADAGKRDAGKADAGKPDAGSSKDDDDDETGSVGGGGEGLCVAEPANACEECGCTECADEMAACNDAEGEAAEGPQAGTPKSELCRAVVECGREVGCRGQACISTPCAEQIFAAAELENDIMASLPTLIERAQDPMYAVTFSSAISTCTVNKCTEACM